MALELITGIILPRLLAASVQSLLVVLAVLLVCRLFPRLSASARAGLWWLVALQLVVGVLWSSPLALPLLPADSVQQAIPQVVPLASMALQAADATDIGGLDGAAQMQTAAAWSWSTALAWAWMLGFAFMTARTLRGYLATRQLLRESQVCRDRSLLHALQLAAEAHGLRRTLQLRLSSAIDSPQLIGPWNPVLLLPHDHAHSMHADELDMALTHELVHLQRGDLWWGLLPAVAQHLFFFNPLAHFAAREYALAREAACDAAVIAGNRHCAHEYGRLLVRLGVAPRPSAGLASASPTFHILKRRLLMLQNTATTPRVVALLVIGTVAVLGVMPYRITAATAPVVAPTAQLATAVATPAVAPVAATVATPASARVAPVASFASAMSALGIAPPAPPAPPAAPTPPSAPSHAVPAAPAMNSPAPPAPPAAPAAPAPLVMQGTFTLGKTPPASAFVLMSKDDSLANASMDDLKEARATRRGNEELLWLRKGKARYVVRDAATLASFHNAYAETVRLGEAQGELGERQGRLGEAQGELGEQQGEIGMQMAELATEAASKALAGIPARNTEKMAALQARQQSLAEQMQPLARRQAALGSEQAALGAKQAAASERAARESNRLIEQAIKSGIAQPLRQ